MIPFEVKLSPAESTKLTLLRSSLEIAVPLWIDRYRNTCPDDRIYRAHECAQYVAEHGDVILYRDKKKGESAKAFNHLAEGVALASFAPGGITLFGLHFDATEPTLLDTVQDHMTKSMQTAMEEFSRLLRDGNVSSALANIIVGHRYGVTFTRKPKKGDL